MILLVVYQSFFLSLTVTALIFRAQINLFYELIFYPYDVSLTTFNDVGFNMYNYRNLENLDRENTEEIIKEIKKDASVTHLAMRCCSLGRRSTEDLIRIFKALPPVTELDLSYNDLGSKSEEELIRIFQASPASLIDMDVSNNNLKSKVIGITQVRSWTCLNLTNNSLDSQTMRKLRSMLQNNYILQVQGVKELEDLRKRNENLAKCLRALHGASNMGALLDNRIIITQILYHLKTQVPELLNLSENSHPREAYRLLTAMKNMRIDLGCDLARMSRGPNSKDLQNLSKNQYTLTDTDLYYFDYVENHQQRLTFSSGTFASLLEALAFDKNRRPATREDLSLITSYTGHSTYAGDAGKTRASRIKAFQSLLPGFTHPPFQKLADIALGLLLLTDFSLLLKTHKLEKTALLFRFHNCLNQPEILALMQTAISRLAFGIELTGELAKQFAIESPILSLQEFRTLLQNALNHCKQEQPVNQMEILLLEGLSRSRECFAFACQSPAFLKVFKARYPEARSFIIPEHCLIALANESTPVFIDVPETAVLSITEEQVHDFVLQLINDDTDTDSFIQAARQSLQKQMPELIRTLESDCSGQNLSVTIDNSGYQNTGLTMFRCVLEKETGKEQSFTLECNL